MLASANGIGAESPTGTTGGAASGSRGQDSGRAARFILVGDTGTGDDRALRVAEQIRRRAEAVPVSHVFLLGDNVYEHGSARAIASKFLDVYRGVLSLGVRFHAALGNHDVEYCSDSGRRPVPRDESAYELSRRCEVDAHLATPEFGYRDGFRYYSIELPGESPDRRRDRSGDQDRPRSRQTPLVEVFVLDSNTLGRTQTKLEHGSDEPQLRWLAEALERSGARWKVVAMHHPMYTPRAMQVVPIRMPGRGWRVPARARADLSRTRCGRRLPGPSAFVRAAQAAARHPVLRDRRGGKEG